METIIADLTKYFQYSFVIYALVVGVLIAFCSSLFGATLVLKRFSYIGDGLSHVAFGAMSIATVLNITNDMPYVLVITVIAAVFLLKTGESTKIQGDAAIAMLSVCSMAGGYLILNLFGTSTNLSGDVCSTLFGATAILTLKKSEVWVCIALAIFVAGFFLLFYHKIFAITFDESFSVATGIHVKRYNTLIAIIVAVVIVLAMNLVGSLLISALIIMPALSAMAVFKSFRSVVICSVIFSIICTVLGILVSLLLGTPVGATIVTVDMFGFLFFQLIGFLCNRFLKISA
ncbi:MAG: metal ABC transporter permease [Eubacteriales bacterium]